MYKSLTKENIKLYAAGEYDNPGCSSFLEFEEDYKRVRFLKTLLKKFVNNKPINIRLIINHIVCLSNVFPRNSAVAYILFTELHEDLWNVLATFLLFLSLMPASLNSVKGRNITLSSMSIDTGLLESLEKL